MTFTDWEAMSKDSTFYAWMCRHARAMSWNLLRKWILFVDDHVLWDVGI
ncbi:hypothetical protein ACFY8B_35760 [Streptomyces sp. NPDC012751]